MAAVKNEENEKGQKAAAATMEKYPIETLRKHCIELFQLSTSTFDGAMCRCKAKEMTIKEAKDAIEKWLKGGK